MSTSAVYVFSIEESVGMSPRQIIEMFVRRAFDTGRKVETISEDGKAIFSITDGTRRYQVVIQPTEGAGYSHYEILTRNDAVFCRSCKAQIVFLTTKRGATIPVNLETVNPQDSIYDPKIHTSHFATCPDAKSFRRKGEKKGGTHAKV